MFFSTNSSDKQSYRFAMFSFSVLVNSWNLAKFVRVLEAMNVVFLSKNINHYVQKEFDRLQKYMDELGEDEPELGDDNDSAFEDDHPMPADDQYSLWTTEDGSEEKKVFSSFEKPFGPYLLKKLEKTRPFCESKFPSNPMHEPKFMQNLVKNWLPLTPFWSHILRGYIYNIYIYIYILH